MLTMQIGPAIGQVEFIPRDVGRVELVEAGPSAEFGVHLGDGVFCDLNGNVALVPGRSQGSLSPSPSYEVLDGDKLTSVRQSDDQTSVESSDASALVVTRPGLAVVHGDFGRQATTIAQNGNGVVVSSGDSQVLIQWSAQAIEIEARGNKTLLVPCEGGFMVDAPGTERDVRVEQKTDGVSLTDSRGAETRFAANVFKGEHGVLLETPNRQVFISPR